MSSNSNVDSDQTDHNRQTRETKREIYYLCNTEPRKKNFIQQYAWDSRIKTSITFFEYVFSPKLKVRKAR